MRSAPAVDYPLGGGATLRSVHRVLAGVILFLLAAWTQQTRPTVALACAGWALGLAIIVGARRLAGGEACGLLSWTGRLWWLHLAPQPSRHHARPDARQPIHQDAGQGGQKVSSPPWAAPTRVDVVWDGQHWLLLYLRPSGQSPQWACVSRATQPLCWSALRRALMRDGVARVEGRLRGGHA